jgi:hypothetical protein
VGAASAEGASAVSVYPLPDSKYNLPGTQISFRGIAPSQIGQVKVVGSVTGAHAGQLEPHSDGDGASFVPAQPFAAGEKVTVTTSLTIADAYRGGFSFTIAKTAGPITPMPLPLAPPGSNGVQYFHSRPDLQPAAVEITKDNAPSSEGDIFVAPQYGPNQDGPMILDPHGRLIWFDPFPVSQQTLVTDFRVQAYKGQPVLTWWQGYTNHGSGRGEGVILNSSYQQVATVQAGNGLMMDLHEFLITAQETAWVVAVSPLWLKGIGKPVMDAIVQEIDIPTGLVMFEWHALDHIPTSDSYFTPKTPGFVFDPYHVNSVSPIGSNTVLISARNTSAIYDVNQTTGKIAWQLGGKHNTFKIGSGVSTAFQHDAILQPDGSLTIFDDGAGPPALHKFSRGIRVDIDTRHFVARLARQYDHSPDISSDFEGNLQELSSGDVFMGWGQQPYFSEDNAQGQQILDGRFVEPTSSYRAYRFAWSGQPPGSPALAAWPGAAATWLYTSWNGATNVAAWRVLAGTSPGSLTPLISSGMNGFETAIQTPSQLPYYAVQALSSSGATLATSNTVQVGPHLALFGRSAFVSGGGTGAIPAECVGPSACSVSTTVSTGRTVIASTGREVLGAGHVGLLFFHLSGAGRSMLAHARGRRLAATISSASKGVVGATTSVNLVPFSTSGSGPRRSLTQSSTLQILGGTDFVSHRGVGGVLIGCLASTACRVAGRLSVGSTTIATTRPEFFGPGEVGYLMFSLSSAGSSLLARAAGNQLGTTVSLSGGGATASGQIALVRFS